MDPSESRASGERTPFLLYLIFILSGSAGLIYESIWSRYLGLFVGHSAYAQVIVLVIFLGGMALGALLAGRFSHRIREPLLWYAGIEVAVGLLGLVFHRAFGAITGFAYGSIFPAFAGSPFLLSIKWLIAGLLVLPQSILLGATFPLMSAGALRLLARADTALAASVRTGRVLAMLYFANSLGAAAGVLVAGFYLIRIAGLPGTLAVAAVINLVVGALVAGLALLWREDADSIETAAGLRTAEAAERLRTAEHGAHLRTAEHGAHLRTAEHAKSAEGVDESSGFAKVEADFAGSSSSTASSASSAVHRSSASSAVLRSSGFSAVHEWSPTRLWNLLLGVSFGTAVASFIYEIAWIRMLSFVLGSATHSFELMLSAFILGLALGSLWIRSRIDRLAHPLRALGIVQVAMGLLAVATLPLYLASFEWTASLLDALRPTDGGYRAFTAARYGLSLAVMLPSTFCAGITLPLITAMLLRGGAGERAIGTVYGVNTFGSIVGVTAAALVLMPLLGLKNLLFFGATLDIAIGLVVLVAWRRAHVELDDEPAFEREPLRERAWRRAPLLAAAASVLLLAGLALASRFDRSVLTSGVYRFGTVPAPGVYEILYYRDGRTATVSVRTSPGAGGMHLATNGKPDASLTPEWFHRDSAIGMFPLRGDASTQLFLGTISMAHAPHARTAAVIGHGSGMTSHMMLANPRLERLTTIEIEPEMVDGSRFFRPINERVFADPRSRIVIDDAKAHFAAGRGRYDLIISEPSNPWVSGVSGLFTTEFYDRVKQYLTPGGVFGQWLHLYEIDDDLVLDVFAALHAHFPAYEVYLVASTDLLIVATNDSALPPPDWSVMELPGIREDLRHILPIRREHLDAMHLVRRETLDPLLSAWRTTNSDYYPTLDLGTERTRFLRVQAEGFTGMQNRRFDPIAALEGRRIGFVREPMSPIVGLPRLLGLAMGARIRDALVGPDSLPADEAFQDALFQVGQFRATLAGSEPPTSWRHWVRELLDVESRLHGGTAGAVDSAFYRDVFAWLDRVQAPHEAVTAARFMRALAGWDFADASFQGDVLAETRVWSEVWLPLDYMRDGMVTAKLLTGDLAGARARYDGIASGLRAQDRLVSMILGAHLARAEQQARSAAEDVTEAEDSLPSRAVPRR